MMTLWDRKGTVNVDTAEEAAKVAASKCLRN